MTKLKQQNNDWFIYILRCADNTLYTGIAKDVEKRLEQHNKDDKAGAKYTRARRPVELVYFEVCESRSLAAKRECAIKKLSRLEKLALIG
ncbi:MAG: GIY-YIG nuclease family protein [Gammaproteobacteria bacterium]|nr:GIY-YIG nuclease family protein [Gammaproteobacteria bacterium]